MLHFAGGSCYSFSFIAPILESQFEVIQLELPGRGKRMDEVLLTDFDAAARDVAQQILEKLDDQDFLIFGHSMGASLSLRSVNLLVL